MATKPKTCRKMVVKKMTTNFREAVSIETVEMCRPEKDEVCIKNKYVGVNATDINVAKGRYAKVGAIGVGMEGVGEIVEIGKNIDKLQVGQLVAYMTSRCNSYAEYVCVPSVEVYEIPEEKPEYLTLLLAGETASIGLDKAGGIKAGETVLITAAAGGTGHIAVQWAKAADCHVIGTCSSEDKETLLKELGCDRVINYKKENLAEVLANEYKKGVDVVWETIGGEVFETCVKNLATKGRLVIVGYVSSYKYEDEASKPSQNLSYLPGLLLSKCASLHGFLRREHKDSFQYYFQFMKESLESGKLRAVVDDGKKSTGSAFFGMEDIVRAVEYLHSGKSVGKVFVRIS